jgi:hypothetical protein
MKGHQWDGRSEVDGGGPAHAASEALSSTTSGRRCEVELGGIVMQVDVGGRRQSLQGAPQGARASCGIALLHGGRRLSISGQRRTPQRLNRVVLGVAWKVLRSLPVRQRTLQKSWQHQHDETHSGIIQHSFLCHESSP